MNLFIKFSIFLLVILLFGCSNKYAINLSNVSFQEADGVDIMSYQVTNPTAQNLSCNITFKSTAKTLFSDSFEIKSHETKEFAPRIDFPNGKTNLVFDDKCKPI